jgi:CDP-2,3-bis-(O-geranylgeranyl)-sn-glycerol synthase
MPHSSRAPGLDQIPESLLPCLLVAPILPVTLLDIVAIVLTFVIADVAISEVLFHLGIRDQPY